MTVILGVTGGIAAYKACELLRRLTESGLSVKVVPTASALEFVGAPTWAALSGQPVATDVWTDVHEVPHVALGRSAELVVVAPATADLLARAAHGLADDLLTNTLLTARCPVLFAPAMHTEMWEHPATRANVALLRERGAVVLEPAVGRLTGPDTGKGRLPDPAEIAEVAFALLRRAGRGRADTGAVPGPTPALADLTGRRVVVSAGGTREFLDPVRFIGNRSSGRQGYALARTAAARGARVTLVAANTALPDPAGVDVVRVVSTEELRRAVLMAAVGADAVVMAAAPADFRPADQHPTKIKKVTPASVPTGALPSGTGAAGTASVDAAPAVVRTVDLVENPDILAELVRTRDRARKAAAGVTGTVGVTEVTGVSGGPVIVGFAAETGDESGTVLDHGHAKLARKGCDLLVVNDVSDGKAFESSDNAAVVLGADGSSVEVPHGPKEVLADTIWDLVTARFGGPPFKSAVGPDDKTG